MKLLASLIYLLIMEALWWLNIHITTDLPYYSQWIYNFNNVWMYILIAVGFTLWRIISFSIKKDKGAWHL